MMYKIDTDPITGKLRGYTEIRENIPLYNDDVIVESLKELDGMTFPAGDEAYEQSVKALTGELAALTAEEEKDYLMRLVVDEEKELAEAREMIRKRRQRIGALGEQLKAAREEHEEDIRRYYMDKDAAADAEIDFRYYSAVILLIKDENRYLREWIDWHFSLGFDHIYIYDNGVKEHAAEIVDGYPQREKITVIGWGGRHAHIQQDAYNHFLKNHRQEVRWGLFTDSDEFVRFTDGKTTDVNGFLKEYEDYTEIWGHEVEYNANGKEFYEPLPVRERFTQETDVRDGWFWKNFIQVNRISHFTMHYAQYNEQKHFLFKNEQKNSDLFVIEHYYTKSWEEWNRKIKERGGADPNYHKALSEFFIYNPDMKYLDTGEDFCQAYE